MVRPVVRFRLAALGLAVALVTGLAPAGAQAARLLGGREQSAVVRAFQSAPGHAGDLVVSVRISTAAPGWAVARWVTPTDGSAGVRRLVPALHSSYFQLTGGTVRAASPPRPARRDLQAPFRVRLLYTGSGAETITYTQTLRSACNANANYVDQEQVVVRPMSWSVSYVVALDHLQAALRSPQSSAALPTVSFDRAASELLASEQVSRTTVDQGCFGTPATIRCTHSFYLASAGAADDLSLVSARGTEVGVPLGIGSHGNCAPENYPLGPSLWDSGGATALARGLDLMGHLPPDPYAALTVHWPTGSASQQQGFLTSPCQGLAAACGDSFRFSGQVQLVPISG